MVSSITDTRSGARLLTTLILTSLALLLTLGSAAAVCINYGDYLHWVANEETDGAAIGLTVSGNYAYLAGVFGLVIMDITTPEAPITVGSLDIQGLCTDAAVSGDYAYVTNDTRGMRVVDVSNPANPILVATVDTPNIAVAVTIQGNYAYVADDFSGLQIIDIANPLAPFIVGGVDTPGMALDVVVVGIYAYVADNNSGVQVVDVSDPMNPAIVANILTAAATGVAAQAGYLYIADSSTLQVADITDPLIPTIVGSASGPLSERSIAVSGNLAYVAGGLQTFDISDPTNPVVVGAVRAYARDVAVMGNHAYLATEGGRPGLHVIDVTAPESPDYIGAASTAYGIRPFVVGDYAYNAAYSIGLQIIDVSTPEAPVLLSTLATPGNARDVHVVGSYAFVADEWVGVQVVDVSDPLNPLIVASVATGDQAMGIVVAGSYAYVADGVTGMQVIDISDVLNPLVVGGVDTGFGVDIDILGSTAYVVGYFPGLVVQGLSVVNVVNPANPVIVGTLETPGSARGIDVGVDHAYIADGEAGLQIIDISNPFLPAIVGGATISNEAAQVMVGGIWAYVVDFFGMKVINIMDPTAPSVVGQIDTDPPGGTFGVFVTGDYVYIGARENGLQIAPLQCESVPAALQSFSSRWTGRHVEVSWQLIDIGGELSFDISRRADGATDFTTVDADITRRGREFVFADPSTLPGKTYHYRVGILEDRIPVTAFETTIHTPFADMALEQNYPNPFNPTTRIAFSIEYVMPVTLSIHDAAGRRIATLIDEPMVAGEHVTEWNGRDARGMSVASGVYFYRLTAGNRTLTRKAVMLK